MADKNCMPSKMHFIFTGGEFYYLYYLSIVSALVVQKFDEFFLWILQGKEPVENRYYMLLKENPRLVIQYFDYDIVPGCQSYEDWKALPAFSTWLDDPQWHGVLDRSIACHVKDYISYTLLYKHGGMYLDLDTFSVKDCATMLSNTEAVLFEDVEPFRGAYNPGTFCSNKGSPFFGQMIERWKEASQNVGGWGWSGVYLLTPLVHEYAAKCEAFKLTLVKELSIVGGLSPRYIDYFDDNGFVYDGVHIMHLYSSFNEPTIRNMDETFVYKSKSPFAKNVKTVLPCAMWNPYNVPQPRGTTRRTKTFHLLGLSHVPTNRESSLSCAYSMKVLKLGRMLKSLGHRVCFYGVETSNVECDEFIQCLSMNMLEQTYGKRVDLNKFYDLSHGEATEQFNANAIREINSRKKPKDFLLCMYGYGHKPIADGVGLEFTVEPGIGYTDTFSKYRIFESYNWMSFCYGLQKQHDGCHYDFVIPNYFDPEEFEYCSEKEDYFFFLGRLIGRKGIQIAIQVAEAAGIKLIVAGQECGENINLQRPNVEYVGYVGVEARKRFLSKAKALLVPTQYIPPFEGVHIEAAFSGTPVITSDWGCFGETVIDGVTGFRCRTFDDYIWAVENINNIDPYDCYTYALNNYSMDRLKWRYEEYFEMLLDLMDGGWYQRHLDRSFKDCLTRKG